MSENKTVHLAPSLINQLDNVKLLISINGEIQCRHTESIKTLARYKFKLERSIVYNIKRIKAIQLIEKSTTDENVYNNKVYLTYLQTCKLTDSYSKQLNLLLVYLVYNCHLNVQEIKDQKDNLVIEDKDELIELAIELITKNIDIELELDYFENLNVLSTLKHYYDQQLILQRRVQELSENLLIINLVNQNNKITFKLSNSKECDVVTYLRYDSNEPLEYNNVKRVIKELLHSNLNIINEVIYNLLNTPNI